jgi:dipeptidyl aminopeptidase/acylaminoacyl peptidase
MFGLEVYDFLGPRRAMNIQGNMIIPRALLFGNPSRVQAKLSPDGQWLTWLAATEGVLNVWLAPIDDLQSAEPLTRVTKRPIVWQDWAYDGRNVLFMNDENGDENWRIFAVDRETGVVRALTPLSDIAAQFYMRSPDRPDTILVGLNDRDKRWHDVWAINLATGEHKLVFENTQDLGNFVFDWQLNPRLARQPQPGKGGGIFHRLVGGKTEPFLEVPQDDDFTTTVLLFNRAGNAWTMLSSLGRNTSALIRVDAASVAQTVLAEHPKADIGRCIVNSVTGEIDAVAANYVRQEWIAINPEVASDLSFLQDRLVGQEFQVESQSANDDRWIVLAHSAEQPATYFLYDRPRQELMELFNARPELKKYRLRPMQGHVVKSRDGLDLVSYLTLPGEGRDQRPVEPLPLVLVVHGGPWGRDSYGFNAQHQWLANRGYAVLSVNYRASAGFGKAFVNAGDKEHAGKMHEDLLDAVDWSVREGIARRDKVAIIGASYGGYAALVGLTFTPDVFCCGVSIVGVSNLVTLLQTVPPYWADFVDHLYRRYADPRTEEGRAWLMARSPLFKVHQIRRPLLIAHGANDVRCKQAESDRIVAAMHERSLPVTYVVYPNEGHGLLRPENRLSFFAIAEAFFAEHLGGRNEPIGSDFAESSLQVREGIDRIPGLRGALHATTSS